MGPIHVGSARTTSVRGGRAMMGSSALPRRLLGVRVASVVGEGGAELDGE